MSVDASNPTFGVNARTAVPLTPAGKAYLSLRQAVNAVPNSNAAMPHDSMLPVKFHNDATQQGAPIDIRQRVVQNLQKFVKIPPPQTRCEAPQAQRTSATVQHPAGAGGAVMPRTTFQAAAIRTAAVPAAAGGGGGVWTMPLPRPALGGYSAPGAAGVILPRAATLAAPFAGRGTVIPAALPNTTPFLSTAATTTFLQQQQQQHLQQPQPPAARACFGESATRKNLQQPLCIGARCNHLDHWRRLRGKKGFAYYDCSLCGMRWRFPSKGNTQLSMVQHRAAALGMLRPYGRQTGVPHVNVNVNVNANTNHRPATEATLPEVDDEEEEEEEGEAVNDSADEDVNLSWDTLQPYLDNPELYPPRKESLLPPLTAPELTSITVTTTLASEEAPATAGTGVQPLPKARTTSSLFTYISASTNGQAKLIQESFSFPGVSSEDGNSSLRTPGLLSATESTAEADFSGGLVHLPPKACTSSRNSLEAPPFTAAMQLQLQLLLPKVDAFITGTRAAPNASTSPVLASSTPEGQRPPSAGRVLGHEGGHKSMQEQATTSSHKNASANTLMEQSLAGVSTLLPFPHAVTEAPSTATSSPSVETISP